MGSVDVAVAGWLTETWFARSCVRCSGSSSVARSPANVSLFKIGHTTVVEALLKAGAENKATGGKGNADVHSGREGTRSSDKGASGGGCGRQQDLKCRVYAIAGGCASWPSGSGEGAAGGGCGTMPMRRQTPGLRHLQMAAQCGHLAVVKAILGSGADIHNTLSDGYMMLMVAVVCDQLVVVDALLEAGADAN